MGRDIRSLFVALGLALVTPTFLGGCATPGVQAQGVAKAENPYGADILENTNKEALTQSLLVQMDRAGLPKPITYNLFPETHDEDPSSDSKAMIVIGESAKDSQIETVRADFNLFYINQPSCDVLSINQNPLTYRTFVALHETTHHVADNLKTTAGDMNDDVFSAVTRTPSQGIKTTLEARLEQFKDIVPEGQTRTLGDLLQDGKTPSGETGLALTQDTRLTTLYVASVMAVQIQERIADASATLYILSNYTDTPRALKYVRDYSLFRQAHYMDTVHDTSSSIEAAITAFKRHPIKGLSIVQTTQLASKIIKAQHDLNSGPDDLAQKLREKYIGVVANIVENNIHASFFQNLVNPGNTVAAAARTVAARNSVCVVTPTQPVP